MGISRSWRDSQGSVGAGENLLLVFAGFHAPVFSTALADRPCAERTAIRIIVPDNVRSESDGHRFVKMLVDLSAIRVHEKDLELANVPRGSRQIQRAEHRLKLAEGEVHVPRRAIRRRRVRPFQ